MSTFNAIIVGELLVFLLSSVGIGGMILRDLVRDVLRERRNVRLMLRAMDEQVAKNEADAEHHEVVRGAMAMTRLRPSSRQERNHRVLRTCAAGCGRLIRVPLGRLLSEGARCVGTCRGRPGAGRCKRCGMLGHYAPTCNEIR